MKRGAPLQRRTPLRSKPKGPAQPRERRLPAVPAVKPQPRAVMARADSFAAGVATLDKPETFRSERWLAAVRSLPLCVRCRNESTVQAAHRNQGKGKGLKTHDCWTAALGPLCHAEIDQGRDMTRDQRRAELDRCIVLTLAALVQAGKVAVVR